MGVTFTTFGRAAGCADEPQQLRPRVPLHHLGRVAWPSRSARWWTGARPAFRSTEADIQPFLEQAPPPARRASPRSGRSPTRVRILSGVYRGAHHRHADQPPDRQRRPAFQGLFGGRARPIDPATPTMPMTPNTACAIHRGGGRSSARETAVAGRGGGGRARAVDSASRRSDAYLVEAIGGDRDRPAPGSTIAEIDAQPVLLPRPRRRRALGGDRRRRAQGGLVAGRGRSPARRRACPAGWGAPLYAKLDAELAAACMSDQRGQGRRDRRRLRRGGG